ncbi:glycosyltransferase [Yersinia kristensenii]|uniref:glycosyltransferase n=1 Tax=Yersinia kristensenii TaxID=28152 RepID=UPI001C609A6D|nr:glycosyltransferase [Yersinia kristensenii]MBW5810713.1 hypothetical protein [Yersinia kristensenii]MBW5827856.1 hypothetical protein [Yersinia kristensenii]
MKKIAIYKVLIGDYDELTNDAFKVAEDSDVIAYDYYFISDRELVVPEPWKLIFIQRKYDSAAVENRLYKIGVPEILSQYDYTIYLDSNISINGDLNKLLNIVINDDHYIYAYPHFINTSVEEEITNCFIFSRINYREMCKAKLYLHLYLKNKVGFECGVLIRKKQDAKLTALAELWFELYFNNVRRDQFYFSIALKRLDMECHVLGENDIRSSGAFFKLHSHKRKITFLQKIYIAIKMRVYSFIRRLKL